MSGYFFCLPFIVFLLFLLMLRTRCKRWFFFTVGCFFFGPPMVWVRTISRVWLVEYFTYTLGYLGINPGHTRVLGYMEVEYTEYTLR